ncbi:MAG: hypothetical protein R3E79_55170 [Caldilineaceae bacterium]
MRGKLNHIKGQVTEFQLAVALRSRKRFRLADFFAGASDETPLTLREVQTRVVIQRSDGGVNELDIVAYTEDDRVLLVEVKNQQEKATPDMVALRPRSRFCKPNSRAKPSCLGFSPWPALASRRLWAALTSASGRVAGIAHHHRVTFRRTVRSSSVAVLGTSRMSSLLGYQPSNP